MPTLNWWAHFELSAAHRMQVACFDAISLSAAPWMQLPIAVASGFPE
ncbi:hypothetical protein [Paenibacillus ihbetae]|nr:hypothetical protein [Paenibacillus ihbetae]